MGISVWIVTGDNRATAEAVAATVGIGRGKVMAGVLPADKARKVRRRVWAYLCFGVEGVWWCHTTLSSRGHDLGHDVVMTWS